MASPLFLLVASAVVSGGLATLIIIVAISVDGWQDVSFSTSEVAKINATRPDVDILSLSAGTQLYRVIVYDRPKLNANATHVEYYVHSSYNGLWRTCDTLSDSERSRYKDGLNNTITRTKCFVLVTDYDEDDPLLTTDAKQLARLQTSAASCYIVVLIDLSSAIVVGFVGIYHKQVASCMVTGVLYLMAALFSMFGLAMFHTKHYYQTYECMSLDKLPELMCGAMQVDVLYGVPLAWVGVIFALFACTLWLIFARALRVIMAKTML